MHRGTHRGFTLLELMITVAVVAVLSALAFDAMSRTRPRASFNGAAAELQSLVHEARMQALAQGLRVAVMVFPDHVDGESKGRIVVYQDSDDPATSIFNPAAALHFDNYQPGTPATGGNGSVVTTLDLPRGVEVGPSVGLGRPNLPFPYDGIPTGLACSFCNAAGNHRGAIVFDGRGRATFRNAAATLVADPGGSLSIFAPDLVGNGSTATSTLVVTAAGGTARMFHN